MHHRNNIKMAKWIGDGYEKGSLSVDGSMIKFGTNARGTPFNIRLDGIDDNDTNDNNSIFQKSYYFTANVQELDGGALGLGIVNKNEFKSGWKCKGMFYNGNLSNGSAALLTDFGDFIKGGDQIGVLVIRSKKSNEDDFSMELIIYLNGRCLGSAFKINEMNNDAMECYYPCLHIDGNAVVNFTFITNESDFPSARHRQACSYGDSYSGDWLLKKIFRGPELSEHPLLQHNNMKGIILSLHLMGTSHYNLSVKVGNTLRTNLHVIGHDDAFDKIEIGRVMSTMMRPTPEQSELEQLLSSCLPSIYKCIVTKDNVSSENLILNGPTVELICERHEKQHPCLNRY